MPGASKPAAIAKRHLGGVSYRRGHRIAILVAGAIFPLMVAEPFRLDASYVAVTRLTSVGMVWQLLLAPAEEVIVAHSSDAGTRDRHVVVRLRPGS